MDELADSTVLVLDREALRARLAADGYLFFRGLLPAREVRAAGAAVAGRLQSGGWLSRDGTPASRPRAVNPADALADPAFRAALAGLDFNRIPYLPALRTLVRRVLGDAAFSYPAKVLRAVYPEQPGQRPRGRYVHYDYAVAGVQDMLTSWVPLIDIPAQLGGLAVQPGGHLGRLQPPRLLSRKEPGWASTGYRLGDVIIFHSLTPHAALPNDARTLRLSGDFRWQLPDQPVPAELVLAPGGRTWEMFSRLFRFRRWWEPVPGGLALCPKSQLLAAPPGPSRFFRVHPSWRHWQPPPGTVH
ncbi:MAG TPA: phytanoyl-CoA dioxygenase family protein [Streptosporangiaceae bacterium]